MTLLNLKQFFIKNTKNIFYFLFFIILFFSLGDFSFAETDTSASPNSQTLDTFSFVGEGILKGLSLLLALVTYLSTIFLSPTWINGSLFGLDSYLKDMWLLISNVVYFVFAFILIWIAFMNIIGRQGDQYQLKQALPKFIVGVLIVPISWFIVQLVLSISAFLTIAALSLPFSTFPDYNDTLDKMLVPKVCVLNLSSIKIGNEDSSSSADSGDGFIKCSKTEDGVPLGDVINNGNSVDSIFGIISMYSYGILSLDTVDDISFTELKDIKTTGDLVVKIITDLLFVLVYGILMVALGMVLFIRGIYIWIYTMLSPIFGLMYFFDKKEGGGDGFFSKFNIKEFIALAMVPVYTMLALSFGLLFIYIISTGISTTAGSIGDGSVKIDDGGIQIGKFTLEIQGVPTSLGNVSSFAGEAGEGALGVVGSLIIKVFGIVLLWSALMAAMRSSEITKVIVEPLHSFGTKVGGIITSSPGNIPIFGGQSMNSMSTAAGTVSSAITTAQSTKGTELGQMFSGGTDLTKKYQAIWNKGAGDINQALSNVKEVLSTGGLKDLASNKAGIDAAVTQLSRLNTNKGFKDEAKATELINELKNKGLGSELTIDKVLTELDALAVSPIFSILGGEKLVGQGSAKDHMGGKANNADVKSEKIKLDINTNQDKANINIGGSTIPVKEFSDLKIKELGKSASEKIAENIKNNFLKKEDTDELFSDLFLSENAKKEVSSHFWEKRDGSIVFAKNKTDGDDGYRQSSLDKYHDYRKNKKSDD